jgi:chromosome segregation ATPase
MSDQPLTLIVLAQFHRQVILPDIERVVHAAVGQLRLDMNGRFDAVYARLDRLEDEYQAIKEGLRRLETRHDHLEAQVLDLRTRLGRVEERLEELVALEERYPVRAEVQELKTRIDQLQEDIRRLEQRIKP